MQAFDIEQLRTFVNVAEAGSITAGAQRVFLSQSAASEQLRKLEDRAGCVLLHRSRHGAAPTADGERLLEHARNLLAMSDQAWRDMHQVPLQGELRLGVTDYFRPSDLTQLLAQLSARYPGVRLHVTIGKSVSVVSGYANGDFDIALAMSVDGKPLTGTLAHKEPLRWLAAPGAYPQPGAPLRLITLSEGCALRSATEKLLRQRRMPYTVVHVASGVAGMQAALVAGLGVACLNESALCAGVEALSARVHRLPALGRVGFYWLAGKRGDGELVGRVRGVLEELLG